MTGSLTVSPIMSRWRGARRGSIPSRDCLAPAPSILMSRRQATEMLRVVNCVRWRQCWPGIAHLHLVQDESSICIPRRGNSLYLLKIRIGVNRSEPWYCQQSGTLNQVNLYKMLQKVWTNKGANQGLMQLTELAGVMAGSLIAAKPWPCWPSPLSCLPFPLSVPLSLEQVETLFAPGSITYWGSTRHFNRILVP